MEKVRSARPGSGDGTIDGMAKKEKRFEKVHSETIGFGGSVEILRDTRTGVCYLWRSGGYGGGMTVLVGADGRPLIDHSL